MTAIFLKILNMGITAGWLILAVILLRLILKKAPKWIDCLLWGLVGIRLIVPFSIQSVFSLIPNSETVPADIGSVQRPSIDSGITVLNEAVNPVISAAFTPQTVQSVNPMQILVTAAAGIWLAGIFAMLFYALVSYLQMKRSVRTAAPLRGNIMVCDEIESPFILGVFKPVIYIPSSLQSETAEYVIEHETAHLKRRDHFFKPLGYLMLAVYWFNPLCWVAYALLCRDIEQACDEKVIRGKEKENIAAYSQALLDCSLQKKRIAACPLAFGEVGVKQRVKGVLNYKKPAFWIVLFAVIACVVLSVCFMTDPFTSKRLPDRLGISMDMAVAEHNSSKKTAVSFSTAAYDVLQVSRKHGETVIYAYMVYAEYGFDGTNVVREAVARSPVAVTFDTASAKGDVSSYDVLLYWTPRDGSYFESDIRETFPLGARIKLWRNGFRTKEADRLEEQCLLAAREYFGLDADGGVSFTFPGDASSAVVQHAIGGRLEKRILEGREFMQLKAWFSNLKCIELSFEPGRTPGDVNGGETYMITVFSENESASYSYVNNGNSSVYLVVEQKWYWVKNASDPPVSFDAAEELSAAEPSAAPYAVGVEVIAMDTNGIRTFDVLSDGTAAEIPSGVWGAYGGIYAEADCFSARTENGKKTIAVIKKALLDTARQEVPITDEYSAIIDAAAENAADEIVLMQIFETATEEHSIFVALEYPGSETDVFRFDPAEKTLVRLCRMEGPRVRDVYIKPIDKTLDLAVHDAILEDQADQGWQGECGTEGHILLGMKETKTETVVYVLQSYASFGFVNDCFTEVGGHSMPLAIHLRRTEAGYSLLRIDTPRDGGDYAASVRRLFPKEYRDRIFSNSEADADLLWRQCVSQAEAYLQIIDRSAQVKRDVEYLWLDDLIDSDIVNNAIRVNPELMSYPLWIGTREQIENGVRYVYAVTQVETGQKNILFYKAAFESPNDIVESFLVNAETGEIIGKNSFRF